MKKQLLNDRQRDEAIRYLAIRPNKMPSYVRGIRMTAKELDFVQIRSDLTLLEELANLDVKIGRKTNDYQELKAQAVINHPEVIREKTTR